MIKVKFLKKEANNDYTFQLKDRVLSMNDSDCTDDIKNSLKSLIPQQEVWMGARRIDKAHKEYHIRQFMTKTEIVMVLRYNDDLCPWRIGIGSSNLDYEMQFEVIFSNIPNYKESKIIMDFFLTRGTSSIKKNSAFDRFINEENRKFLNEVGVRIERTDPDPGLWLMNLGEPCLVVPFKSRRIYQFTFREETTLDEMMKSSSNWGTIKDITESFSLQEFQARFEVPVNNN